MRGPTGIILLEEQDLTPTYLAEKVRLDLDKAILDKLAVNYERDWPAERRL